MPRSPESDRPETDGDRVGGGFTRRALLIGAGGLAAGSAVGARPKEPDQQGKPRLREAFFLFDKPFRVPFTLNGELVEVEVEPRTTLLQILRHRLAEPLTGTKEGCDRGTCGACTVLLDGLPVYACTILAGNLMHREVTTIEALGTPEELSEVQKAFCEHDAMMCGFCTPGVVLSVTACLEKDPGADEQAIRTACSGHVCRCGTQPQVVAAAREAGRALKEDR